MRKLSRRDLILSLLFPAGIIAWALFYYIRWAVALHSFQPIILFQWSYPAAAVLCGVIPIIITLASGANTGQYILPRVLISVSTLGAIGIASEFIVITNQVTVLLLITSAVVSALYFYKFRQTRFSEWIVIFLSNPVLAAVIYYIMFNVTLNEVYNGI